MGLAGGDTKPETVAGMSLEAMSYQSATVGTASLIRQNYVYANSYLSTTEEYEDAS